MRGDSLPARADVVRYIRATGIQDGVVNGSEFCLRAERPDEHGLSVNWLQVFANLELEGQPAEVRARSRIRFSRNGRLAQLNVGYTIAFVAAESPFHCDLPFIEDPLSQNPTSRPTPRMRKPLVCRRATVLKLRLWVT
jgi:hypothetical protein